MFQRILLPVDLSDRHEAALKAAAELGRASGAEIVLLHVIELIPGLSVEGEKPFYARLERKAREHLQQLGRRLDEARARWRVEVRLGRRAGEVVAWAREAGTDLIVLTSPTPDPANALAGLGSLSFHLGVVAPCPVLLVR